MKYIEALLELPEKDQKLAFLAHEFDRKKGLPIFPLDGDLGLGNCGLIAVAIATRNTYSDVKAFMKPRSNKRLGSSLEDIVKALEHFGKKPIVKDHHPITLQKFCETIPKNKKVLIIAGKHIMTYFNGLLYCQNYPAGETPFEHSKARAFVKNTIEIDTQLELELEM